ncbi:MAG: hypothetical protein EBW39_13135, partial [Betaproteobacteria bacterium]|nr:hypothetical protein [Betaproteobacteria bacterium]
RALDEGPTLQAALKASHIALMLLITAFTVSPAISNSSSSPSESPSVFAKPCSTEASASPRRGHCPCSNRLPSIGPSP